MNNLVGIFDTHAHYDDVKFNENRDELLSSMKANGVSYICNVGADLKSSGLSSIYFLNEILSTNTFGSDFTADQKDLLIFAILIHDGFKHGVIEDKYTKHEHPLICAICLRKSKPELDLTEEEIEYVAAAVESHMGEWNKSNYSDIELALPITKAQKIVHLSDMLSSKKILNVDFVGNEIKRD